ncbi:MAG: GNAT family N-acetyltransferase [Nocardioidaceae bacterium]
MLRTRPQVRVLGPADLAAVRRLLDRDPVRHVFVDHRVRLTRLDPRRLGGEMWGYDEGGELVSMCHVAANLVPVQSTAGARRAFASRALSKGRHCSAILGPDDEVADLWRRVEPRWGPARSIRLRQPFLALDKPPAVEPSTQVRRVRADELDVLYPACVAMFTEEVGISPELGDGVKLYRARVARLIARGLAFAHIERGEVVFKAEVGAATPVATQIQGVWTNPRYRGQGLAASGMAAVCATAMREMAPVVSLYVNEHNVAARRAYARVGFFELDRFATILF